MLRKETKIFENDFDAATANDLASSSLDLANVFYEDTGVENNEYAYDANGNQITKTAESKTEINIYDGLNQLIGFTDGETTASYKYNADGLRTSKTVDGKTINHIWDGNKQIVVDMDDSDWYSAEVYVRGTNLLAKFSKQSGNVKTNYQYYTQNAHGDVVNLTDAQGAITKSYKYDAFGVEQNIDDADSNVFRYCGEYYDSESGTIYLRARYYDPTIGRFISRDSVTGENTDPLSLNLYTYCHNNPIIGTDPSGHIPRWLKNTLKVAAGVAVIGGLAVATAVTGGAAAVVAGAALSGAIAGGASGAVIGTIGGAIENGWDGALDGAVDGFLSGTIIGGATGALSSGVNIARGTTQIVGKAHGTILHKIASNMEAGKMAASGRYSQIGLNKSLSKMGLKGGAKRPDVIGIARKGKNKLVEVVSRSQKVSELTNKTAKMVSQNTNTTGKVISMKWARLTPKKWRLY